MRTLPPWLEVFVAFLRLGLSAFGGPIAHLGYFHRAFVERRRWLDEASYGDIVALCQFLPGPASSQTGILIGLSRGGYAGAVAAWVGFTLPSAVLMVAFAYAAPAISGAIGGGWLHGLKLAAVAVVAQAVLAMLRAQAPDAPRATLAVAMAAATLALASPYAPLAAILVGAAVGLALMRDGEREARPALPLKVTRPVALAALALFAGLVVGLPLAAAASGDRGLDEAARFFRVGSLVFGGGHVVLPLLQREVVDAGWVDPNAFLAGYGAAQALPGPLFSVAAYLGAVMRQPPTGLAGAAICLGAIFLPSFLLVFGVAPFWEALRRNALAQGALKGANAAVVGVLMAALYDPVWTGSVGRPLDVAVVGVDFLLLTAWRAPPWLVVIGSAVAGVVLNGA
ncbi:MAG TPA: chromate efflux transporter [Caulobacteraceae bacterium]|nr:chromate efflux transporter [Caulobacteraceae bacterium]